MRSSVESEGAFVAVSVGESTLFLELVNAQTRPVLGKVQRQLLADGRGRSGSLASLASLLSLGVF